MNITTTDCKSQRRVVANFPPGPLEKMESGLMGDIYLQYCVCGMLCRYLLFPRTAKLDMHDVSIHTILEYLLVHFKVAAELCAKVENALLYMSPAMPVAPSTPTPSMQCAPVRETKPSRALFFRGIPIQRPRQLCIQGQWGCHGALDISASRCNQAFPASFGPDLFRSSSSPSVTSHKTLALSLKRRWASR